MMRVMYLREKRSNSHNEIFVIEKNADGSVKMVTNPYHSYNAIGCVVMDLDESRNKISYAVTVVHPSDRFNRKHARHLTKGKLMEEVRTLDLAKEASRHDITEAVMTEIANSKDLPNRAVKSAKLWLRFHK